MNTRQKKALYESIMKNISKLIKNSLNELKDETYLSAAEKSDDGTKFGKRRAARFRNYVANNKKRYDTIYKLLVDEFRYYDEDDEKYIYYCPYDVNEYVAKFCLSISEKIDLNTIILKSPDNDDIIVKKEGNVCKLYLNEEDLTEDNYLKLKRYRYGLDSDDISYYLETINTKETAEFKYAGCDNVRELYDSLDIEDKAKLKIFDKWCENAAGGYNSPLERWENELKPVEAIELFLKNVKGFENVKIVAK